MDPTKDTVTGAPVSPDVVPTTVTGGSVPQGTAPQGTSDAVNDDPVAKFQGQLDKLEQDRRRQQSVYDRQIADLAKRNQDLLQQLEATRVKDMSEQERAAYEATKWKEEYDTLKSQMEAERQAREYARAFAEAMGLPEDKLDMTNQETVAQSGWQLAIEEMQRLREEVNQLRTGQTVVPGSAKQPPPSNQKIITGSGGVPRTKPTQSERVQSVARLLNKSSITMDEYYTYLERNPGVANQWLLD